MRESNAKMTQRKSEKTKRIAKRAVLLAALLSSGSAAMGQDAGSGIIRNSYFDQSAQQIPAQRTIVRRNMPTVQAPKVGSVRLNPFYKTVETPQEIPATVLPTRPPVQLTSGSHASEAGRANGQPYGDQPLIEIGGAARNPAAATGAFDRFSAATSSGVAAGQGIAANADPVPLPQPQSAAPIVDSVQSASSATTPMQAPTANRVQPVADTQSLPPQVAAAEPIVFSLSDDTLEPGDAPIENDSEIAPERSEPGVAESVANASEAQKTEVSKTEVGETEVSKTETGASETPADPTPPSETDPGEEVGNTASKPATRQDEIIVHAAVVNPAKATWPTPVEPDQSETKDADERAEPATADNYELVKKAGRDPRPSKSITNQRVAKGRAPLDATPVRMQGSALAEAKPIESPADEPAKPFDFNSMEFAEADAPIQMAPEVQFGEAPVQKPNVASSIPGKIRTNPAVAENRPPAENTVEPITASNAAADEVVAADEWIALEKSPSRAKPPVFAKSPAQSSQRKQTAASSTQPEPVAATGSTLRRDPVAVAMPPLQIERLNSSGEAIRPAIGAASQDPMNLMAREESPSPAEEVRSGHPDSILAPADTPEDLRIAKNDLPILPAPSEAGVDLRSEMMEADIESASDFAMPGNAGSTEVRVEETIRHRSLGPTGRTVSFQRSASDRGESSPVLLRLKRAQVRSMTIAGQLRRASVNDNDVCQAFSSGSNQLKLIGTGIGKTELTIWADVAPGEPTRTQTFVIIVSDALDATGGKITENTDLLNESIDRAFPRASVVVSQRGGQLIVTGRCDNEDTAKQIIRMVRKSCLIPVKDNLKVR